MRVEACPYVYQPEDRRQRTFDRRSETDRREPDDAPHHRARHAPHVWFQPAFGAHILGQMAPEAANTAEALHAYTQPESRTPLRPHYVERA